MGKENPFYAGKLILICFLYFHNVFSSGVSENNKKEDSLIDKIKVCATVRVIGNSSYIKSCGTFKYPKEFLEDDDSNLALCMLVLDTTNKICEYSSKLPPTETSSTSELLPSSVQQLDANIEKFEHHNSSDICKNISSIFNKLNHSKVEGSKDPILTNYLDYSKKTVLTKKNCEYTCHSIKGSKLNHLCTYLLWANEFFTSLKPINANNDNKESVLEKEIQHNTKVVLKETHEKNNEKQNSKITVKNETNKIDTPNIASESENQQNKQKLSTSTSKKSDDAPKNPMNPINTSNNEPKVKPNDQKQLDESNNHSLAAPPKEVDTADIVESKKNEGDIDNVPQLPPDEANQDGDSISAEDHQNKKENDDLGEGIDRENAENDQKETNNHGVEVPIKNPVDNEEFQERPKLITHSQTSKEEEESYFFTYFSIFTLLCIALYIAYHNKQKILAILLEGRRSRRGRGSRRRPSTASYRKLDCNLEEAVTSQCNSNVTHVIY